MDVDLNMRRELLLTASADSFLKTPPLDNSRRQIISSQEPALDSVCNYEPSVSVVLSARCRDQARSVDLTSRAAVNPQPLYVISYVISQPKFLSRVAHSHYLGEFNIYKSIKVFVSKCHHNISFINFF